LTLIFFHWNYTYTETDVPVAVPKNESSKRPMPWQGCFIFNNVTNTMVQTQITEPTIQYSNPYLPSHAPTNNWWRNHSRTCISWSTNEGASWLQD